MNYANKKSKGSSYPLIIIYYIQCTPQNFTPFNKMNLRIGRGKNQGEMDLFFTEIKNIDGGKKELKKPN